MCGFGNKSAVISKVLLALVLLGSCSALTSCRQPDPGAGAGGHENGDVTCTGRRAGQFVVHLPEHAQRRLDFNYATAEPRLLDFDIETIGQVLANANLLTRVTAPLTGRVQQAYKSVGDYVKEGEPLLEIRSTDVEQAEADLLQNDSLVRSDLQRDLLQIDSDIKQGQAQVRLSEATFLRMSSLVTEKIASRADFESARTQFEKDKIALAANIRQRSATVALADERIKLLNEPIRQKLRLLGESDSEIDKVLKSRQVDPVVTVDAPSPGIVIERLVNVGELVDPARALFKIGNYHTVWLEADIAEKDQGKVKAGQPIVLCVDSLPGDKFSGRLNYVSDSINPETRTLVVRAEVDNPGLKLKPKMYARMTILVREQRVLTVPRQAVQDTGTYQVVYVPAGRGCFEERRVKLGASSGDFIEVVTGMRPGERVVTRGSGELMAESLRESG